MDYVRTYIDDLLVITKGTYEDHLEKLRTVILRLQHAGLKINADKSEFALDKVKYLGFMIYRNSITPIKKSVCYSKNIPSKDA